MVHLDEFRHRFSACPCGHGVHVASSTLRGKTAQPGAPFCAHCENRLKEFAADVAMTFVEIERLPEYQVGALVDHGGAHKRVVFTQPIEKLPRVPPTHAAIFLRPQ